MLTTQRQRLRSYTAQWRHNRAMHCGGDLGASLPQGHNVFAVGAIASIVPHGVGAYASNFVRTFIGSIGTEAHLKVAVGACWKLELLKITGG